MYWWRSEPARFYRLSDVPHVEEGPRLDPEPASPEGPAAPEEEDAGCGCCVLGLALAVFGLVFLLIVVFGSGG